MKNSLRNVHSQRCPLPVPFWSLAVIYNMPYLFPWLAGPRMTPPFRWEIPLDPLVTRFLPFTSGVYPRPKPWCVGVAETLLPPPSKSAALPCPLQGISEWWVPMGSEEPPS